MSPPASGSSSSSSDCEQYFIRTKKRRRGSKRKSWRNSEDEECHIDYAVRRYKESLQVKDANGGLVTELCPTAPGSDPCRDGVGLLQPTAPKSDAPGRRVSFLFDTRRALQTEYTNTTRRFTDGDFHNLKLLRLDRPQRMIKQKTYSGPSLDQAGHDQRRPSAASLRRAFTDVQNKEGSLGVDTGLHVMDSSHKYGGDTGSPHKYGVEMASIHKYGGETGSPLNKYGVEMASIHKYSGEPVSPLNKYGVEMASIHKYGGEPVSPLNKYGVEMASIHKYGREPGSPHMYGGDMASIHKYSGETGSPLHKYGGDRDTGSPHKYAEVRDNSHKYVDMGNSHKYGDTSSPHMYVDMSTSSRNSLKVNSFMEGGLPPRGLSKATGAFKDSPPLPLKPYRTEVSVEVHREAGGIKSGESSSHKEMVSSKSSLYRSSPPHGGYGTVSSTSLKPCVNRGPPRGRADDKTQTRHAHSLETVSPTDRLSIKYDQRRVKSYDGELLTTSSQHDTGNYDRLEITEFNHGPFYNADYDVMCEGRSPELRSKVRYNDTGSLEEVTDEDGQLLEEAIEESDDTESTLNGTQKYRELWTLRATFEEEEDFSDTIRMEDVEVTSPEDDQDPVLTSVTTSFESTTDPAPVDNLIRRLSNYGDMHDVKPGSANLLHPNYESRRETYRSILSKRLKRIEAPNSTDNSFDSVETLDTDGDVSDTSRPEQTTTSFESTTDNTDSTGERETHRLQQMRDDSGYKSLEAQQTLPAPLSPKRQDQEGDDKFLLMPTHPTPEDLMHYGNDKECASISIPVPQSIVMPVRTRGTHLDRRSMRTASKKRREYSRERQGVCHVHDETLGEAETDSRSDHMSGDSFDENHHTSGKFSVFSRFFRSQCHKRGMVARDYSIDEKTNAIFHEFVRHDPYLDARLCARGGGLPLLPSRGAHPYTRHRSLHHRKSADTPPLTSERRRNKLTPDMRSVSLGSDSSTSSVRRLSPQDSIEEEECEQLSPIVREQVQFSRLWSECKPVQPGMHTAPISPDSGGLWAPMGDTSQIKTSQLSPGGTSQHSLNSIKQIPIIRLPDDEAEVH